MAMFNHRRHKHTPLNAPVLSLDQGTNPAKCWIYGCAFIEDPNGPPPAKESGFTVPCSVEELPPPVQAPKPRHFTTGLMGEVLASPLVSVGHIIEPQQRVIQVCIGAEHGVMLTDEAVVFTWGDNRYGQLGRNVCLTEEDGKPFPVLAMVGEEVVQVAAGKHHCLALASGLVWGWGRNKVGQLGCGDFRDRVSPEQVRHPPDEENQSGAQLGSRKGESITSISANACTSLAAGGSSMVWQWGEINNAYLEDHQKVPHSSRSNGAAGALKMLTGGGRAEKAEHEEMVTCTRPMAIMSRETFRTRMRRTAVCISDTACQVLQGGEDLERTQELIEQIRALREQIEQRRAELKRMERRKKKAEKGGKDAAAQEAENEDMGETVVVLEAEMAANEAEIELFKKNLESCDRQQAHHREQLQQISEQAVELSEKEDKVALDLVEAKKGTVEWKELQEKLHEVKDYIQANQNARMTVLDRRAQTDKEKQRLSRSLDERIRTKADLASRVSTMRDLSAAATRMRETSDVMLKFLSEQHREFFSHFEGKNEESEFISAMQDVEGDYIFLRKLETKTKTFMDYVTKQGDPVSRERAQNVNHLLRELLGMRRLWDQLSAIGWLKNDLDLSSFFDKAAKPKKGARRQGSFFQQPALPWAPPALGDSPPPANAGALVPARR